MLLLACLTTPHSIPPLLLLLIDPQKTLLYFTTGVNAKLLKEGSKFPPQYQYTVTGATRKKRSTEAALGVRVSVNDVDLVQL